MQAKQLSAECIQCRKTIIAEAEARFRTIFSSSPVGIVLADLDSDEIKPMTPIARLSDAAANRLSTMAGRA
jgi:PAS domain-containing protein